MIAGFHRQQLSRRSRRFSRRACAAIERHTGWPALGLVPFCAEARRACRPRMRSGSIGARPRRTGAITIAVPVLPRIANFDDLDPLELEAERAPRDGPAGRAASRRCGSRHPARLARRRSPISRPSAREGWDIDLSAHLRRGGRVLGLCGGYQMLGRVIRDPDGIEGPPGEVRRLGPARRRDRAGRRQILRAPGAGRRRRWRALHGL